MATYCGRRSGWCYGDIMVDSDQIVEFTGQRNDEKLLGLGYVQKVPRGAAIVGCKLCGAQFVSDTGLSIHGRRRHSGVQTDERAAEAAMLSEARQNDAVAPLHLDKTSASRGYKPSRRA